jgi:NAD-dependent deacetylase
MSWFRRRRGVEDEGVERLAQDMLDHPGRTVLLTGAGVSVASGIPSFRDPGGLWERYDPTEYAHIGALRANPVKAWTFLWEFDTVMANARPNASHTAAARLEHLGLVRAIITQNPDGLHGSAGSATVIELHGNGQTLSCMSCGGTIDRTAIQSQRGGVPYCPQCAGVLRPDITFFGEELPRAAVTRARAVAVDCDVFVAVGTSGEVEPAASLPDLAARQGATVWEINPNAAPALRAHERLALPAETALPALVRAVTRRARDRARSSEA